MSRYRRVVQYLFSHPWAIMPERLEVIADVIQIHIEGRLTEAEALERVSAARQTQGPRSGARQSGVTAVIPVYGVIIPRASMFAEMSGATSIESLRGAFREALADDDVARIVFDVDSPGGSVDQVPEFAEEIRAARGQKPITAVANTLMASAAYWIASQADEIVASPSALVGSIGVYAVHEDWSGALEQEGIKPTIIKAGRFKAEGSPMEPLSDDAREYMQSVIDDAYDMFTTAVAKGRGVTAAAVRAGYGEGRVMTAKRAKAEGLVDRIDTFDASLKRIPVMRSAAEEMPGVVADDVAPDVFAFEREQRERLGVRPC